MAQLRLGYPDILRHDAEILQVTHNTVEEARRYQRFHQFAFPYLCDPDRTVHERYGLPLQSGSPISLVHSFAAATADLVVHGDRTESPIPFALRHRGKDSPQALLVLDRGGVVRAVHQFAPNAAIPPAAALLTELAAID
jgi:hypothetical protein